jgi:hypothetical protein
MDLGLILNKHEKLTKKPPEIAKILYRTFVKKNQYLQLIR